MMAMLTLNGTVQNFFVQPARKDKEGNERPESMHVQILAENVLESGEKRLEMVTLKVITDLYKQLIGKRVAVPVGAFAANGSIMYYALRNEVKPYLAASSQ